MPSAALNATITGHGDPVLVLGNGLGTGQHTWRYVVDALRGDYRLVRFDYVGTPDIDAAEYRPERYETLHGYADDVVAMLNDLDVRDATWIGHSASGIIGLIAATIVPDRIANVVTISASPRYLDDDETGYTGGFSADAVEGILRSAAADYSAWVGGFSPMAIGNPERRADVDEFASHLRRLRPDIAQRTLKTIFTGDYRSMLSRVTQHVTVIQPAADTAVPRTVGSYLASHLPSAQLRELHAAGHVPQLTAPNELVSALRQSFVATA